MTPVYVDNLWFFFCFCIVMNINSHSENHNKRSNLKCSADKSQGFQLVSLSSKGKVFYHHLNAAQQS